MREAVEALWIRWHRFWFDPKAPDSLAVFRILLGAFFLVYWLLRAPHVTFLFSKDGFFMPVLDPRGSFAEIRGLYDLVGWLLSPIPVWATWSLFFLLIVALTLFTVGAWTRIACAVYFTLYLYFYLIEMYQLDASYDRLFLQTTLFMCFARCDEVLSVKGWRRDRAGGRPAERVPFWPARLIGLQMMLVYLGTGFHKLLAPSWDGWEIMYYSLISYWGTGVGFWIASLVLPTWFYQIMVYATIAFELFAPIGLHVRRFQPWYFAAGFLFHAGIGITLSIWQFMAMPAAYVLFLDPEAVKRFCRKATTPAPGPG